MIVRRTHEALPSDDVSVPPSIAQEARHTFGRGGDYPLLEQQGERAALSCPDCGGPMWHMGRGEQFRLRCHSGHAYALQSFLGSQEEEVERALGTALRALTERARMWSRVARNPDRSSRMRADAEKRARGGRDRSRSGAQVTPRRIAEAYLSSALRPIEGCAQ